MGCGCCNLLQMALEGLAKTGLDDLLLELDHPLLSLAQLKAAEARHRRDTNERLVSLMLEALVDEGTLDAVEAAIEANDQHDEKITELGDLWRFAEAEGEDDAHIRLQAFERQLGDEFDWEWWERQVFAEHAKQWAADALDMCDLMDDLLIWCKLAAPSASVSLVCVAVFEPWSCALPRLTDSLMTVFA